MFGTDANLGFWKIWVAIHKDVVVQKSRGLHFSLLNCCSLVRQTAFP